MILNRNNYEEFFMLYVDNELPDADRKAVESFIRKNPDLEGELTGLLGTKMKPENGVFFENKELLLKQGEKNTQINHINYLEFFLFYVDAELNEDERKMVEAFAATGPFFRKELLSFQQARIEPEPELVFEGKEILYRKDNQIRFLPRVAAAAAVLFFIVAGYYAFQLRNKNNRTTAIASESKRVSTPPNNAKEVVKKAQAAVTPATVHSLYLSDKSIKKSGMENNIQREGVQPKRKEAQKTIIPEVVNPSIEVAKIDKPAIETVPSARISFTAGNNDTLLLASYISPHEFKTFPEGGDDQTDVSESKNKMRGLFRKVSRVFGMTTNAGEEKTKRGIVIGGFQIALK